MKIQNDKLSQPNLKYGLSKRQIIDNYSNWMFSYINDHIAGKVIEVGAGTGNITSKYILKKEVTKVFAVDIFEDMLELLNKRFNNHDIFFSDRWNIEEDPPELVKRNLPFDTVVCINVLEHIENDFQAMKIFNSILDRGGKLVLLVPAHKILFGKMDKASGHYRRYEKKQLENMLIEAKFNILLSRYMNVIGTIPWFINGRIKKIDKVYSEHLSIGKLSIINKVSPFLQIIENIIKIPFGLTIIVVGEKL